MITNFRDDASLVLETVPFPFQCYEVPGVKILTYNGPIYYGNRNFFREEMSRLLGLTPEKIRSWEKARKALEKREREVTVNTVVRQLHSPNMIKHNIPAKMKINILMSNIAAFFSH